MIGNPLRATTRGRWHRRGCVASASGGRVFWIGCLWLLLSARVALAADTSCLLIALQGDVRVAAAGTDLWQSARTNLVLGAGMRLRTGTNSTAVLRLASQSIHRMGPLSEVQATDQNTGRGIRQWLIRGMHYFLDRDGGLEIETTTVAAASAGTEFVVQVDPPDADSGTGSDQPVVKIRMLDGKVRLYNRQGSAVVQGFEQADCLPGQAPKVVGSVYSAGVIQWCLYYPAVLDPDELVFSGSGRSRWQTVLGDYRSGDIVAALAHWPATEASLEPAVRVLRAALDLAAGNVEAASAGLRSLEGSGARKTSIPGATAESATGMASNQRLARSLGRLVAAISFQAGAPQDPGDSVTAQLVESYAAQSRGDLASAWHWAQAAAARAPRLGLAQARLAEMLFSHGDLPAARKANAVALRWAPRHPQVLVLDGFLLAAAKETRRAAERFEQAIQLEPRLGNAWLGRGLCRFRLGEIRGGLDDLIAAAALEPNRGQLRATLAKGWQTAGQPIRARQELDLAMQVDAGDPTPLFYHSLLDLEENRLNPAMGRSEEALARNKNRAVFRSRFGLDEDLAVRGTALARIYRRAGLGAVSEGEAARSVAADFTDASAHLFYAEVLDGLRDSARFDLRYETAWFNELLLGDLLAPVGAGTFTPNLSQQEYSQMFAGEGVSLTSTTEVRSDGRYRQLATQSGFYGGTAWSLDMDYQHYDARGRNRDLDRVEWYSHLKQQVSDQDTALLLVKYQDFSAGDLFARSDPGAADLHYRFEEDQHPQLVGGWRHQWSPGQQTLMLAGRLESQARFQAGKYSAAELYHPDAISPPEFGSIEGASVHLATRLEDYFGDLCHVVQSEQHTLLVGGRIHSGQVGAVDRLDALTGDLARRYAITLQGDRAVQADLDRASCYIYETWRPVERLSLTAGLAWDEMQYPANFRRPPLLEGQQRVSRWLPKAALVWEAAPWWVIRGAYARSQGGISLDESFRLEPVQLAGFSQAFRTLIPESLVGSLSAPAHEIVGLAMDFRLPQRTYLGARIDALRSSAHEGASVFVFGDGFELGEGEMQPATQSFDFHEYAATVSVDKLLGDQWSVGMTGRRVNSRLRAGLDPGDAIGWREQFHQTAALTAATLRATWNSPRGWFAGAELSQIWQDFTAVDYLLIPRQGDVRPIQLDVQLGWRFPRNRGEITVGIQNMTASAERLAVLSGQAEYPDERVFFARLRFQL